MISLDVPGRRIDLDVPAEELQRRSTSKAAAASYSAPLGWQQLYVDHVMQADREWIWTSSSAPAATPRPAIPTDHDRNDHSTADPE